MPRPSAKDPVNMAGYVIENLRNGAISQFHWSDVESIPKDGSVTLLDVRTPQEVAVQGLIRPDAVNIPVDELRDRMGELDPSKPVYVNCYSGLRSYLACRMLGQRGFQSTWPAVCLASAVSSAPTSLAAGGSGPM